MDYSKILSKEELERLRKLYSTKELKRKEIISALDYTRISIIVREGVLRKFIIKDGKEKTVDLYFSGDLVLTPNFDYQPIHPYKIQAIEPSKVDVMNMEAYNADKNKSINLLKMDVDILETALTQTMRRMETFQFMSATERYLELLSKNPEMVQKVPLIHIASYLGINNASLSKIRASLK